METQTVNRGPRTMRHRYTHPTQAGLSLVEILITLVIVSFIFAMVYTAFIQTRKVSIRNQADTEILQSARIVLDEMSRTLRMIGYGCDTDNEQVAFIEAAPFQISFNADLDPDDEAMEEHDVIKLYDATAYSPPQQYETGAETIRITLDSHKEGSGGYGSDGIIDQDDIDDNIEEELTAQNPNDMVLFKEINGGRNQPLALSLLGPFDAEGESTEIVPLFQYWILKSDNSFALLGDENGDGECSSDEACYLKAVTSQENLKKIRRIRITVTTESDVFDPFDRPNHRRVVLSSEISLRNLH